MVGSTVHLLKTYTDTSIMNVDEFVSRSSSLPILEKIWLAILNEAYSAGTNEPIWAMICSRAICRRYVDFPLWIMCDKKEN